LYAYDHNQYKQLRIHELYSRIPLCYIVMLTYSLRKFIDIYIYSINIFTLTFTLFACNIVYVNLLY
jgi:hypothetical protein